MKRIICFFLSILLLLSAAPALAERAKVQTPGGWLNMRSKPSTKAAPLEQIPNNTTVTYLGQTDDTWSQIKYQGITGYVQTRYLNLTKTTEGKVLYPDGNGAVYVRKTASDNGKILAVLSTKQAIKILKVENDWTQVSCTDADGREITGYIRTERIDDQYTQPQETTSYYDVTGISGSKQALYEQPSKSSEKLVTLPKGTEVKVLYTEGTWCKVEVDGIYIGFVPADSLQITGDSLKEPNNPLISYHATYYLCSVPSGSLPTYVEPTGDLKGNLRETLTIPEGEKLAVVQKAYQSHGAAWAQVIWKGQVYWTPASAISVSKETGTMYYTKPIDNFTGATVYAGSGGAKLYAAGSRLSKVLATIPAGTEMDGSLRERCIAVTYKGQQGYVFYSDVICGLAWYQDPEDNWNFADHLNDPAPTPTPTPMPAEKEEDFIPASKARSLADQALESAYNARNLSKMQVNMDRVKSKRGSTNPVYELAYFQDGKYMYNVLIDAINGNTVYTANYTNFGQTVSYATDAPRKPAAIAGEISASKARSLADQKLRSTYGGFDDHSYKVVNERFEKMKDYDEPVFRLNYYAGEQFAYTCVVSAKSGAVLYHTDIWDSANTEIDYSTPTPRPGYDSSQDIGKDRAISVAKQALAGKYPDFDASAITRTQCTLHTEQGHLTLPYYYITFFVSDSEFYSCAVHAYTEKILETFGMLPGEGNG